MDEELSDDDGGADSDAEGSANGGDGAVRVVSEATAALLEKAAEEEEAYLEGDEFDLPKWKRDMLVKQRRAEEQQKLEAEQRRAKMEALAAEKGQTLSKPGSSVHLQAKRKAKRRKGASRKGHGAKPEQYVYVELNGRFARFDRNKAEW